jgi:opacity protein-like surface antigen
MAGMNGTVGFGGHSVQVNQSFTDIFSNLKFGVMGLTEVNRGPVSLLADAMYIRLGNETAIPITGLPNAINVNTTLDTFTLTPYLGYRLLGRKRASIQGLIGVRYYHLGPQINAELPSVGKASYSTSDDWADFVEGARFTFRITPRITAFFVGDAGAGGSTLTYQIIGGAGYDWSKKWSTSLAYRRLYFNRQTLIGIEQTQQGLVVGATYRFR